MFLSIQSTVDDMAQDHADVLIHSDELYHSDIGPLFASRGGPCEWAGEVIYRGGDPDARWDAYANSPSHDQVVNTPRTHHGVGIAQTEAGVYVVVDIFCRAATTTTTVQPKVTTTSSQPPPTTTPTTTPKNTTTTTTPPVLVTKAPPLCPQPFCICIE